MPYTAPTFRSLKTHFWILIIALYACFTRALLDLEVLEKERMIYFLALPFGNSVIAAMTNIGNTGKTCTDESISPLF
jgi:hypothetical protein